MCDLVTGWDYDHTDHAKSPFLVKLKCFMYKVVSSQDICDTVKPLKSKVAIGLPDVLFKRSGGS